MILAHGQVIGHFDFGPLPIQIPGYAYPQILATTNQFWIWVSYVLFKVITA